MSDFESDGQDAQEPLRQVMSQVSEQDVQEVLDGLAAVPESERERVAVNSGIALGASTTLKLIISNAEELFDKACRAVDAIDRLLLTIPVEMADQFVPIRDALAETLHDRVENIPQAERMEEVVKKYCLPAEYLGSEEPLPVDEQFTTATILRIQQMWPTAISAYLLHKDDPALECHCPYCLMGALQARGVASYTDALVLAQKYMPGTPETTKMLEEFFQWWYLRGRLSYQRLKERDLDRTLPPMTSEYVSRATTEKLMQSLTLGNPTGK